jgi:hypothetical protein
MLNNQSMKKTISMIVMKHNLTVVPLLLLVGAVFPPTALVYAQTTTTTAANNTIGNATTTTSGPIQRLVTPSEVAQQIMNNTRAECAQAQFRPGACVSLVYESPTTVVMNGNAIIFGGSAEKKALYPNPFLWKAVDGFKAQGYTITTILMSGAGNDSNRDVFRVILSK